MRARRWVKDILSQDSSRIALILLAANLLLVYSVFLPNLNEINPWDEAAYVKSGHDLLTEGIFPQLAGNPLVSLFYAAITLPFLRSPLWIVHAVSFGRLLLFILLWLSTYAIARELHDLTPPAIALGIFFVTPLSIELLRFPSDPMFSAMAGFSLWQLLRYRNSGRRGHLAWASVFMGLAAWSRNDGLILFPILILLALILSARRGHLWRALLWVVLPGAILIAGYVLGYGFAAGTYSLGTMQRTYDNFESGQLIIYEGDSEINPVIASRMEARQIFGTAEDNRYSVFRAIQRNPRAYLDRLVALLKALPALVLEAYGKRFAPLLLILAFGGIYHLLKAKEFELLLVFLLWPMHLVTGFVITLIRLGHLQFPYYIVFVLAAIGLFFVLKQIHQAPAFAAVSLPLLGLSIYGLIDNKLAIFYGASIFLTAAIAIRLLYPRLESSRRGWMLLVIFSAGLLIRGNFPAPKIRELGRDPKEQSVIYLTENFDEGTTVAAGSPGVVWAANMRFANLSATDLPTDPTSEEFYAWMVRQGISAIYADSTLYNGMPPVWRLIEAQVGERIDRVFQVDRGNYQILTLGAGP